MFDKLRKIKNQLINAGNAITFDPTRFDDPLAEQIRWTPLKSGGSNFRTHKLFEDSNIRVGFKPTIGARLFGIVFIFVGLVSPIAIGYGNIQVDSNLIESETVFMIAFGVAFFSIGSYIYYSYSKPIVFDKLSGQYWKGWKKPERSVGREPLENGAWLRNIYALQIIEEYIRNDDNSYYSYELNLVLRNGERLNVIDHGSKRKLLSDAQVLSKFLDKPIWDATRSGW